VSVTTFTVHYYNTEGFGAYSLTGEGVTADETVAWFLADGHSEDEIEEVLKEN
jgi:hypothetical protein